MHQFGIIKKCLDTVDARYKHEDGGKWLRTYVGKSDKKISLRIDGGKILQ